MEEIWKPVTGYPGYEVSNLGRVRRVNYLIASKSKHRKVRYLRVRLTQNGKGKAFRIAQLVTGAFLGPKPPGLTIDHKNLNRYDDRAENLEYVTIDENIRRAIEGGAIKRGKTGKRHKDRSQFHVKLSEEQVQDIKRLIPDMPLSHIAARFGVSAQTIALIRDGSMWRE